MNNLNQERRLADALLALYTNRNRTPETSSRELR